jgi:hypothetical protein
VDRPADSLIWQPGQKASDFIYNIVTAAGMRLFCDESRQWRLVKSTYSPGSLAYLAYGLNLYSINDTVGRSQQAIDGSPLFMDSCVINYSWEDSAGNSRTATDPYTAVANPTSTLTLNLNKPFPGPGAAAYWVSRNKARGHAFDLTARFDVTFTPGQAVNVDVPTSDIQDGFVSSVSWSLRAQEMTVVTRDLIEYTPLSWAQQPASLTWANIPTTTTWANFGS